MGKLQEYFRAGFSHFVIRTEETQQAIDWIKATVTEYSSEMPIKIWGFNSEEPDPMAPLMEMEKGSCCFILKNYHWFLMSDQSANFEVVQFLIDRLEVFRSKERRVLLFIVCNKALNSDAFPEELKREFVEVPFALPSKEEVAKILDETIEIASRNPKFVQPTPKAKETLIEAARGMTRFEVQNSYFLSLVKTTSLDAGEVIQMRTRFLENVAGVKYIRPTASFQDLRGLERVKTFTLKTIASPLSKGLIFVGPPGTGKTHLISALSNETGFPCFSIEMAEWQGGIVGETEAKVRKAIDAIMALAPAEDSGVKLILLIDELEKGMAGTGGGQGVSVSSDSITQRAMGQWLKFMQDRPSSIYIAATSNNIDNIPPEYLRAERWDTAPFFIDLPNALEREDILKFYIKQYNRTTDKKLRVADLAGWSGAEIKSLCRLSAMLDVPLSDAREFIKPLSVSMKGPIERMRKEAETRFLRASLTVDGDSNDEKRALNF